jgi:hypothetical protein
VAEEAAGAAKLGAAAEKEKVAKKMKKKAK